MRWWIRIQLDLPVEIRRTKLPPNLVDEFNTGKFARSNYKYLYELTLDRKNYPYIKVATPSFKQLLYSLKVLWRAKDGDAYDRHDHPAIMTAFDTEPMEIGVDQQTEAEAKKAKAKFQKSYAKNRKLAAK